MQVFVIWSPSSLVRLSVAFSRRALESGAAAFIVTLVVGGVERPLLRGALVVAATFVHLFVANGSIYETAPASVLHAGRFAQVIATAEGRARLGGWRVYRLKGSYGTDYAQNEAGPIVNRALDLGVNLVDTAEIYGRHESERILREHASGG